MALHTDGHAGAVAMNVTLSQSWCRASERNILSIAVALGMTLMRRAILADTQSDYAMVPAL